MRDSPINRPGRIALAVVAIASSGWGPGLRAQEPYIKIREPVEWRDAKPFIVPPGRTIRVSGVAWHPAGIKQVMVNGVVVPIENDPPLTNFEHVITADSLPRTVWIVVVPETSQRFEAKFAMSPPAEATASRPTPGNTPRDSASVRTQGTPTAVGAAKTQPMRTNAWNAYRRRSLIYGSGAVAGLVAGGLTTKSTSEVCSPRGALQDCVARTETKAAYRAVGLTVGAASGGAAIVDALLTSKRSRGAAGNYESASEKFAARISQTPDGHIGFSMIRVVF